AFGARDKAVMLPASHCVLAGRVRLHRPLAFFRGGGHRLRLGEAHSKAIVLPGGNLNACVAIALLTNAAAEPEEREAQRRFAARGTAESPRRLAARDTVECAMVLGTTAAAREASPEE
ncbi:hypothetical protein SB781_31365, partial [Paraburkholderia sp. SIMBA_061]